MIEFADRIKNVEEYYFSKKLQEVRSLDSTEFPIINLGIGSPDLPPSVETIMALSHTAADSGSHGYQSYKGIASLRESIAQFYNRKYCVTVDPGSMILPLMGSKEGIMHISMAFVNEGDEVLIPDPGYPTYASVSQLVGARIRTYCLLAENDWQIDFEELESRDLSKVKLMWINTPHMPTGSILAKSGIVRLFELAKRHNFLLVNDNPYSFILNDDPQSILSVDGALDVCIELNSLSKSHNMPGWRVGWLVGGGDYIEAVLRVKSNMDSGMFLGIQKAAAQALKQPDQWFDSLNESYSKRKVTACEILDLLGCEYSSTQVGLFVWAKVPDQVESVEKWIDVILYESKVFITPGFIFGKAGSRFIRISLCADEVKLEEAKKRISNWVAATKSNPTLINDLK
ncbi:MAG TPA: aminotransferase class I/II-fold pyridoxal phosphate-dependent enzyme [Cyclobacteriaceae bacterium]